MARKDGPKMGLQNFGLSSLLVVFLALSLLTFAALSLSSAKNDDELSLKLAEHRADYYSACSKAEEILAEIAASDSLPAEVDGISISNDNDVIRYHISVGETQILRIAAQKVQGNWVFTDYSLYTNEPWSAQESLTLIPLE